MRVAGRGRSRASYSCAALQREEAEATERRITGGLGDLARAAMREAVAVIGNGKRACRRASGQLDAGGTDLISNGADVLVESWLD
jgi:hypothetical protein